MSFLKSLFGGNNKISDPVLGALERHTDGPVKGQSPWSGQVQWETYAAPTALAVYRSDSPPTDGDRNLYLNLKRDWNALRLDLQGALWSLWTGPAQDFSANSSLASSIDLWQQLLLQGINIAPEGDVTLAFGFSEEALDVAPDNAPESGLPEGAFCVTLRGREVIETEFVP